MSNKKPNAGKRGKKPALSSETRGNEPQSESPAPDKQSKSEDSNQADTSKSSAKPASSASAESTTKTRVQPGSTSAERRTTNSSSTTSVNQSSEKSSGGWIAPLALLFGLLGTGFSAYLYTQLKALGESTSLQLQSQAESSKTEVSTVRTDLDVKAAELADSIEQTKTTITSALQSQNDSLSAAIEEKSSALSSSLEEVSTSLEEVSNSLEEKSTELTSTVASTKTELSSALESNNASLTSTIESTAQQLQSEVQQNTVEIATSTASAVQELTSKTELEINNVATSFNTGLALLRERTTEKMSQLDKQITELDESVQTTTELASRGQRDWVLAEVNYLLRTGVHRVKLAGDVKAGVIAMESASDRLHTLGDINYLPVREQIAEEVAALRRLGPPDIEGLIFKLQHMSKRADTLPLPPTAMEKTKQALAEEPSAAGSAIGQSLLDKFRGSLKVVPSDGAVDNARRARSGSVKPTKDQLTASDSLRLHLQAARLSALRHDPDNFSDHMENAINYASEIFDQEDDRVTVFIDDLAEIRETNIVPKIPILGSALSLFTKIDSKRGDN